MKRDPSTLSNYQDIELESTHVKLDVNWEKHIFVGTVKYDFAAVRAGEIRLDSSGLKVHKVLFNGQVVPFSFGDQYGPLGRPLHIKLPEESYKKAELTIDFETTDKCTAVQWLEPEQTAGKKAPFFFSQCEQIYARTLFPCFDTPSVKSTYTIDVTSKYTVVASGILVGESSNGLYQFQQDVPIPSYLFAIAGGDLACTPIGPRSAVWSEPCTLEACKYEFEKDTEKFVQAAEKIVFPYEWKTVDLLVLPPSFPFGGMENPNMIFITPTLLSGDRTLVDVIAHEIAHSWSGNLVTNSSWEHFWLNEGWTVYLERRILGELHGEAYRSFAAIIGWESLINAIKNLGDLSDRFSPLVVDLDGNIDPDEGYSVVPYEKGSTFLLYLEKLLGKEKWDRFVPYYFKKWEKKSLDTDQFKETVYEFFSDDKDKLDSVDWQKWLYAPGLPEKPKFDTSLADMCYELADKWEKSSRIDGDFSWASAQDMEKWDPEQKLVFLDAVTQRLNGTTRRREAVQKINDAYGLSKSRNTEVLMRWFGLAVPVGLASVNRALAEWLGTVGRIKFVRAGYRLLAAQDRELALATYKKNENFYHPICRTMVSKDLGLAN